MAGLREMTMGPLDPEMQAILDRRNALGLPGFSAGTPDDARRAFAQSQAALPPARGAQNVTVHDASVPGPHGTVPVRHYRPEQGNGGRILYMHGGGWVFGTLDGFDPVCRQLAHESGAEVVSIDYRLAPEHPFPQPLDDCWAVLEALGEGMPLAVMGDSAGGNLAAALALRARYRGGPPIALQVLLYPVLSADFTRDSYTAFGQGDYLISREDMRWFWDQHVPPEMRHMPEAAPLAASDFAGLPEAIIVVGGCDPLHDEGACYAAALRDAGVKVTLRDHPGMAHGFFTLVDLLSAANAEVRELGALIASRLALP
ncbi:alpha/beta hydrolase [Novosphingobium sp. EMRT-2]|uniref:alpha/beta hydrolase n=1 Tax=Novosphingobium sp. EMRT-2 TaxID=2571749 RepID=UPI0010BE067D|nr:alpha/beta hydrolase [Novosphingobium sp. EMRT-2]QCI96127.1 alpha/beta hydrolase [Novosphingobium sp. EMRT-2]